MIPVRVRRASALEHKRAHRRERLRQQQVRARIEAEQQREAEQLEAVLADARRYYADPAAEGLSAERELARRLRSLRYTPEAVADLLMDAEADAAMSAHHVVVGADGQAYSRAGRSADRVIA